ncbi:hypothetical protein B9G53_01025 [Pseudanabaena sp. SR411]|nr:hypothetical protein B9G53_01025 [Pseudanabaena sp. SR411]
MPAEIKKFNQKSLDDFITFWRSRIQPQLQDEVYWNWLDKYRMYGSKDNYEAYAIENESEQITQGMMLIETQNHRSKFNRKRRIVYVETIETAPWNRPNSQPDPQFKWVGTALLRFAQWRSEQLGYDGIIGLHSLPESENFYKKRKMISAGQDPKKDNLTYFEWYNTGDEL